MPQHFSCGLDYSHVRDLQEALDNSVSWKYHFTCMPIVHPRFRREYKAGRPVQTMFSRTDMLLGPMDWNVKVVGKLSPYLDVDCAIPSIRQQHEDCLMEELNHCRCLGLSAVMITLKGPNNNNLARLIHNLYTANPSNSLMWIQVPMEDPGVDAFRQVRDETSEERQARRGELGTWGWWRDFHRLLEWDRRVGVALRLATELPEQPELERWLGEPVKCLMLPTHVFSTNKKGFPVLPKSHQQFVKRLMERDVHLVVTGALRHADYSHYLQYLEHLWNSRSTSMQDVLTSFAKGWEDYLQTPLQPLSDNLDSHTYNVFEKDPVKYDNYQKAVIAALRDRYSTPPVCKAKRNILKKDCQLVKVPESLQNGTTSVSLANSGVSSVGIDFGETIASSQNSQMRIDVVGEDASRERDFKRYNGTIGDGVKKCPRQKEDGSCGCKHLAVVMVLGAGRGPLVRAVANAGNITNVDLKIYAVEKNPTALLALYAQQREIWGPMVTVVASDMREFRPPQLADIVVSELLGSFGDNELSPECLDGARHLLRPDGISIPSSYTSYICPVMSARLWGHVKESEKDPNVLYKPLHHQMETLWVVYLQNKYDISEPQALFTFTHPHPPGAPVDRRRWASRSFRASRSCTLHGFCGYFSCVLYGQHTLSIVPGEHSPGMISWFPVFIPIKTPINIKPDDVIEANFWRCCNSRKVWYEWNVTAPELLLIHNSAGKSSDMIL